jgi:hypothetical protein
MALPRGDEGRPQNVRKNKHKSAELLRHCYHLLLPPSKRRVYYSPAQVVRLSNASEASVSASPSVKSTGSKNRR